MKVPGLIRLKLIIAFSLFIISCSKTVVLTQSNELIQKPKNVILLIGDGMGLPHISAHIYQHGGSVLENIKDVGLMKTYSVSNLVTDSGASATAMATGIKTFNHALGLNPDSQPIRNLMEITAKEDFLRGIVTNASILDATPAAFYAHRENRYHQDSIPLDLLHSGIDFLVGGGLEYFDKSRKENFVFRHQFESLGYEVSDYRYRSIRQLKLFKHKRYLYFNGTTRPNIRSLGDDHIATASKKALRYFRQHNDKPFFLLVEEAQIDWAGHNRNPEDLLFNMRSFEKTARSLLSFAENDGETLVIITSDHSTGGLDIVQGSTMGNVKLVFPTSAHTASMVPVFAFGPGSEAFRGVMENSDIFYKIVEALSLRTIEGPTAN